MFSRQLVDAVTDVLPSIRGKDGRGRPRLARLHGRKSEKSKKKREGASEGEKGKERRGDRWSASGWTGWTKQQRPRAPTCVWVATRGTLRLARMLCACAWLLDATDTGSRGVVRVRSNVGFYEALHRDGIPFPRHERTSFPSDERVACRDPSRENNKRICSF